MKYYFIIFAMLIVHLFAFEIIIFRVFVYLIEGER